MNKEFVSYTQALALKELGFDEPCFSIYHSRDKAFSWHHHRDSDNTEPEIDPGVFNISAPLYQQAFRWLYYKLDIKDGIMPLDTETQDSLLQELIDKLSSKHLLV